MTESAALPPVTYESPILDGSGQPYTMAFNPAHYGASHEAPELRGWYPRDMSADGELLQDLPTLRARTRDLIRNHGLTSGAVQTHLDNVIGPNLRLVAKPDHRRLNMTPDQAQTWARETEAKFREWWESPDYYCDAARRHTGNGLLQMAYRSYLTSFESLATIEWLPPGRSPNRGGAKYATAVQQLDPALLSNPHGFPDTDRLRAGVELGSMGDPIAYWFASHLDTDPIGMQMFRRWRRVPRETPWGRQMVVHVFDGDMPGQTRGKTGIVSVIASTKMFEKLQQSSLQASILNAMYAAVIESPFDWQSVGAALGQRNDKAKQADPLTTYMDQRNTWHKEGYIRYDGAKIPHLYPGEKFELKSPQHPSAAFAEFESSVLRHLAGGFNMTYEQFSRDYSKTNYSSARAAMLEAWRFFTGRRHFIAARVAAQYYAAWLEEAMDSGEVETPPGSPSFWDAKTAWTRCSWIGPGKGHIDPLKEENATTISLNNKTTTLEKECAERGLDWEDVLEQRAREAKRKKELEDQYGVNIGEPGESPSASQAATDEMSEEEIDEQVESGDMSEDDAEQLREDMASYGIAVRSGAITPQQDDEVSFRERLGFPPLSEAARQAWQKDQGARRPVTLTPPSGNSTGEGSPGASAEPGDANGDDAPTTDSEETPDDDGDGNTDE